MSTTAQSSSSIQPITNDQRASADTNYPNDAFALPNHETLSTLINHFFATIGTVLPYISKPRLFAEIRRNHQLSTPFRALLNIVCAHASSSLRNSTAETFYRLSLALLDDCTLRGASLELG